MPRLKRTRRLFQTEALESRVVFSGSPWDLVTLDVATGESKVTPYADVSNYTEGREEGGIPGFAGIADMLTGPHGDIGGGSDETVFGNDDRNRITGTTNDPYRRAGAIRMFTTGGDWSFCSGSMVGPRHFLTAGHCIHQGGGGNNGWYSNVEVALGRDGDDRWFGVANASLIHSVTGWTDSDDANFDWALIQLDRNIGNITGWNGYWWYSSNSSVNNLPVSIAGYPSDLATQWNQTTLGTDTHQIEMYESTGNTTTPTTEQLRYNGTLDTFGGMSGSSVIENKAGVGRVAVGVHAYGDGGDGTNRATRMREYMVNQIEGYKANDPVPTDRADLVDWDTWFHTNTQFMNSSFTVPGANFRATMYPRNNGTAASGNFNVTFYASTNDFISTFDYPLGTVSVGSLNPFQWGTANLNVAFPNNVPAGNYYVGWIVDSGNGVTEFNEGNNTGYLPNLLTVGSDDHGNNGSSSTRILTRTTTGGNIESAGDSDWFQFEASAGAQVTLETQLGSIGDTTLRLYASDGVTQLAFDDDGGPGLASLINYTIPSAGVYYASVREFGDDGSGTYSLSLSHVDDHGQSTASSTITGSNFVQSGDLEVAGDVDWFTFYATPGTQVTLETSLGTLSDSILRLYAADGVTELAFDDDGGSGLASRIDYAVTTAGQYFVQVEDFGVPNPGSYTLSLTHSDDHAPSFIGATPIAGYNVLNGGSTEVNYDLDTFSFNATVGETYTLKTFLGTHPDTTLTLLDTDGVTQLAFNDDDGTTLASNIVWTAPATGTYFARVTGFSTRIGTYDFAVLVPNTIDGDFNDDGLYDCADVDDLVTQIVGGGNPAAYDLSGDLVVDTTDLDLWLAEAGAANLASGNPYRPGDANLDGNVDGSDFGIWNANKFTARSAWCSGDFTVDGNVDGSDFGIWNANKFTSSLRPVGTGTPSKGVAVDANFRMAPLTPSGALRVDAVPVHTIPVDVTVRNIDESLGKLGRNHESRIQLVNHAKSVRVVDDLFAELAGADEFALGRI
jgi:V8-like Glu-specific endopeptidase